MAEPWRGVNDMYFVSKKSKEKEPAEQAEETGPGEKETTQEPKVRLKEAVFVEPETGYVFTEKCIIKVTVDYPEEASRKPVKASLFAVYNDVEEDLNHTVEAMEKDGIAELEITFFHHSGYFGDAEQTIESRVTYFAKVTHQNAADDIESDRIELPQDPEFHFFSA